MGRKLDIHPLTIIFLLLAAGKFSGIAGMLLAIPGYAAAKVVISHMQKLFILRKTKLGEMIHPHVFTSVKMKNGGLKKPAAHGGKKMNIGDVIFN